MTNAARKEYLSLSPDAYSRFFICKELLKKNFNKTPIKLLDVGGGSKYFHQALDEDKLPYQLTVIDLLPQNEKDPNYRYVQGDATKMKFADNSFDAVVSMDVLEHISDERKANFLQECYRVAKDLVIIAAPFELPETDQAERLANEFYRSLHDRDHPWLSEHFQQNKPKKEVIKKEIDQFGCSYIKFESNYLPDWLKIILVNFLPASLVDPVAVRDLNHFYNENLFSLDDFKEPGYRWFYVLYKNPKLAKKFDQYFKIEDSVFDQLTLEQKLTNLLTQQLLRTKVNLERKLAETAERLENMTKENVELAAQLKDTVGHAGNLQKMLDDIHRSKAYKLARGLGSFHRKITGKL